MIIGLIIVLILYTLLFVSTEVLRHYGLTASLTRKIAHIGASIIAVFLPYLINLSTLIVVGLLFALFLFLTKKFHALKSVHAPENEGWGAVFFPIGLVICAVLFWNVNYVIFQASALILGLSDGLAGLFGKKYGKKKFIGTKTLEGSLIFFIITFLILFFVAYIHYPANTLLTIILLIFASLLITLSESLFSKGWDNLILPVISGFILWIILYIL